MAQGRPTSFGSVLRNGGKPLLYSYPVTRGKTFQPSGDPSQPDREIPSDGYANKTRVEQAQWDDGFEPWMVEQAKRAGSYYESIRYLPRKSTRSLKRALKRKERLERTR